MSCQFRPCEETLYVFSECRRDGDTPCARIAGVLFWSSPFCTQRCLFTENPSFASHYSAFPKVCFKKYFYAARWLQNVANRKILELEYPNNFISRRSLASQPCEVVWLRQLVNNKFAAKPSKYFLLIFSGRWSWNGLPLPPQLEMLFRSLSDNSNWFLLIYFWYIYPFWAI